MAFPDPGPLELAPPSPLAGRPGGARLAVRLTPKASRDRIEGIVRDADGAGLLKVSVTAPAEDGRANRALILLLAKSWKIAQRAITITSGATDRRKILFIEGDVDELRRLLSDCVRTI